MRKIFLGCCSKRFLVKTPQRFYANLESDRRYFSTIEEQANDLKEPQISARLNDTHGIFAFIIDFKNFKRLRKNSKYQWFRVPLLI